MFRRIKIIMLKLVFSENFMIFEHWGRELQRFENFVFPIQLTEKQIAYIDNIYEKQNFENAQTSYM